MTERQHTTKQVEKEAKYNRQAVVKDGYEAKDNRKATYNQICNYWSLIK